MRPQRQPPSPHKCSVRKWSDGSRCENPSLTDTDWQVCAMHLRDIHNHVRLKERSGIEARSRARMAEYEAALELKRRTRNDGQAVVYYVQMPGGLIKIGTTRDLRQRLNNLTLRDHDVLAVEPGGTDVERQRHQQFAALQWRGTERFRDHPDLRSHIELVLVEHGRPKVGRIGQGVTFVK